MEAYFAGFVDIVEDAKKPIEWTIVLGSTKKVRKSLSSFLVR